jgi:hypothetical protein
MYFLPDCLISKDAFQFDGDYYECDSETGICYRTQKPLTNNRQKERVSVTLFYQAYYDCIESIKKTIQASGGKNARNKVSDCVSNKRDRRTVEHPVACPVGVAYAG